MDPAEESNKQKLVETEQLSIPFEETTSADRRVQ